MRYKNIEIELLGHASVKIISDDDVIYIDPYNITDTQKATLILITHSHHDHFSPDDIAKITDENTRIIGSVDCDVPEHISPKERIDIGRIKVEAVAAYNKDKQFHPKKNEWNGYIVDIDGTRIYHAGDTDLIPEMNLIETDIALLPVGGNYTMNASEAANAANIIGPDIAIPMHYGSIVGTIKDAEEFRRLCEVDVKII